MSLFPFKRERTTANYKGRVQCNEPATMVLPDGREISCRLRELTWLGFSLDFIPMEEEEHFKSLGQEGWAEATINLPRDFGRLTIKSDRLTVSSYLDIADNSDRLLAVFDLGDHPDIDKIRDFVSYRNRRFSRHHSSRKSARPLKMQYLLKWFMWVPVGFLLTSLLVLYVFEYFRS